MTEKQINNGVFLSHLDIQKRELIILRGLTTSKVWTREKLSDTPAYCFLKEDCATCLSEKTRCYHSYPTTDIPVIFRIKENNSWIKPKIPKHSYIEVEGNFSNSDKERKSFTAYSYHLLSSQPAVESLNQARSLSNHG